MISKQIYECLFTMDICDNDILNLKICVHVCVFRSDWLRLSYDSEKEWEFDANGGCLILKL